MKKILFILLSTLILSGCFPTMDLRPVQQADLTFEEVIKADGLSKDYLFTNIKFWFVDNFKSAKDVIQYENKDEGTIIGKGIIDYPCSDGMDCLARGNWKAKFTIRIDIKDHYCPVNS